MRAWTALFQDIRFQLRHGFYYVYFFITVVYVAILLGVPSAYQDIVTTILIFSDPSTLGFFFVGGIVLLERDQQILETLFVTPLRIKEYFLSKVISLSLIAIGTSIVIKGVIVGFGSDLFSLTIGVALTSIFTTLLGLNLAVRVQSINQYLIISPFYVTILYVPVMEIFYQLKTPILSIIPSKASLLLIGSSYIQSTVGEKLLAICYLLLWICLVYVWTYRIFYRKVVLRVGG